MDDITYHNINVLIKNSVLIAYFKAPKLYYSVIKIVKC